MGTSTYMKAVSRGHQLCQSAQPCHSTNVYLSHKQTKDMPFSICKLICLSCVCQVTLPRFGAAPQWRTKLPKLPSCRCTQNHQDTSKTVLSLHNEIHACEDSNTLLHKDEASAYTRVHVAIIHATCAEHNTVSRILITRTSAMVDVVFTHAS